MKNMHITPELRLVCFGFLFIGNLAGCQKADLDEVTREERYPYNCSWYGHHELSKGPTFGLNGQYVGEETQVMPAFSYGLPLEINPSNPDQVLVGKGVWDEVAQITRSQLVIIDLSSMEETLLLEWDDHSDPQAKVWDDFRWGAGGWIVAENLNDKQLYLFHPSGGSPQRLTDPALGAFHNPVWVAEGTEVLTLGYNANGRAARIRTVNLEGEVQHEFILAHVPPAFVKYHQFAGWRADSLLVSTDPTTRQSLNIFQYPDMTAVQRIQVIKTESRAPIVSDHEWWPGTERILWQLYDAIYATSWQTGETETIWEDCEQGLLGFAVMPNGEQALCLVGERVMREDLGGTQFSYHLYQLELSSATITRIK